MKDEQQKAPAPGWHARLHVVSCMLSMFFVFHEDHVTVAIVGFRSDSLTGRPLNSASEARQQSNNRTCCDALVALENNERKRMGVRTYRPPSPPIDNVVRTSTRFVFWFLDLLGPFLFLLTTPHSGRNSLSLLSRLSPMPTSIYFPSPFHPPS